MLKDMEQEKNSLCIICSLCRFSEKTGLYCSEEWMQGILGIMGFYYTDEDRLDRNILHGMNASFQAIFKTYQSVLQVSLSQKQLKIDKGFFEILRESIENNGSHLLWIDEMYMSYSPYYQKASNNSLVILYSIDKEKAVYFDNIMRECNSDLFLKAIDEHGMCTLFYNESHELDYKYDKSLLCEMGIKRVIRGMLSDKGSENGHWGIQGMKYFSSVVQKCNAKDDFYNYYYQINRPGGMTDTRDNMSRFIDEIGMADKEANYVSGLYADISQEWRLIGNIFFRLSYNLDYKTLSRNIDRIRCIIQKEEEGVELLKRLSSRFTIS